MWLPYLSSLESSGTDSLYNQTVPHIPFLSCLARTYLPFLLLSMLQGHTHFGG